MRIGPLGIWELVTLFVVIGLPLWAIIVAATKQSLSTVARVLLIGIAVLAPLIGPIAVLIAVPILGRRQAAL